MQYGIIITPAPDCQHEAYCWPFKTQAYIFVYLFLYFFAENHWTFNLILPVFNVLVCEGIVDAYAFSTEVLTYHDDFIFKEMFFWYSQRSAVRRWMSHLTHCNCNVNSAMKASCLAGVFQCSGKKFYLFFANTLYIWIWTNKYKIIKYFNSYNLLIHVSRRSWDILDSSSSRL